MLVHLSYLYFLTYTFSFSSHRARSSKNQRHLACRRTAESQRTLYKALSCSEFAPTSVGWCKIRRSSTRCSMLMFLRDSAKRSCSLHSQPLPKTMAEWRGSALSALPSYFLGQEATSGLVGGRTIPGSVGRLRFRCTSSRHVPPPPKCFPKWQGWPLCF
jgi:hypothetical protein